MLTPFPKGRNDRLETGVDPGSLKDPKAAADLELHLGSAKVPFRLVVGDWDPDLSGKGEDPCLVGTQSVEPVASGRLLGPAACPPLGWRRLPPGLFQDDPVMRPDLVGGQDWARHPVEVQQELVHLFGPQTTLLLQVSELPQQMDATEELSGRCLE